MSCLITGLKGGAILTDTKSLLFVCDKSLPLFDQIFCSPVFYWCIWTKKCRNYV